MRQAFVQSAAARHAARYFSVPVWRRGVDYEARGAVAVRDAGAGRIWALVHGTEDYAVEIAAQGDTVLASCTCPHFRDQETACKHLWATFLAADRRGLLGSFPATFRLVLRDAAAEQRRRQAREEEIYAPSPASRARKKKEKPPLGWRDVLESARRTRAPGRWTRELRYAIDADETRGGRSLVVTVWESHAGAWYRAALTDLASSLAPEDVAVIGALTALQEDRSRWSYSSGPTFELSGWAARDVLPQLCATGRAYAVRGRASPEGEPIAWDERPWTLALEVQPAADGDYVVDAVLERGGARGSARDPAALFPGGVVVWADKASPLDDFDQLSWAISARSGRRVRLAARELDDFVETMHLLPRAPRLALPPDRALAEVRAVPRAYASLRRPDARSGDDGVRVDAGVDYDGVRVSLETPGRAVVDRKQRRLLLRDAEAEARAREELEGAGGRRGRRGWDDDAAPYRVARTKLLVTARALLDRGWRVEIDGRLHRRASSLGVGIASGVDWFDVSLRADFDGALVPFPELLAALRERRRTIVLADGSIGELPDEWVERLRRWAALGERHGAELRFARSQLGVVAALADEEAQVAADDAFAAVRAELRAFEGIAPLDPPPGFAGTLRDYQKRALGWFAFLRRFGFGGCLADDMGLGKTVQVLAMLDARRRDTPKPAPSLVVVPRSLLWNWQAEAARFAPDLDVFVHDGARRLAPGEHWNEHDVVLTTYGLLRRDADALAKVEFDHVVLDEAQAIKNARSAAAAAARRLHARHRLALSGTPLENHLGELASLFEFLNPGMLGAARALDALADGGRSLDAKTQAVLARAIRPFFLRRTKGQVAAELPERVEQTILCELEPAQRRLYDELRAHYRAKVVRQLSKKGPEPTTAHVLEALLRLRQAACHPGLVDRTRKDEPSAKLDVLLERLASLREEGRKALVFSQFTSLLAIVRERLQAAEIDHELLDGKTKDREARVARFQEDPACSVFLLSLKAGGVGLNLTAADCVFVLDPWWNPAAEAQAIDRAHRIGQTRTVFALRLLAKDTVEEKVAELQETKRALADALFGDTSASLEGMTRDDLELLLS